METIELNVDDYKKLYALARRTLHTAFVWNDHNFEDPEILAIKTAIEVDITDFDKANNFISKLPVTIINT